MDRLRNVMWYVAVIGICVGFGFCWLYVISAIDGQIEQDAYSHARIGMMRVLGIMFEIFAAMLALMGFVYALLRSMRNNDPDVGTDDDGNYFFDAGRGSAYSPNLPR